MAPCHARRVPYSHAFLEGELGVRPVLLTPRLSRQPELERLQQCNRNNYHYDREGEPTVPVKKYTV